MTIQSYGMNITYDKWKLDSSAYFPRNLAGSAIGYSSKDNRFWFLGGMWIESAYGSETQYIQDHLLSFDLDTKTFNDYNPSFFSVSGAPLNVYGGSHYYTQIGSYMYMFNGEKGTYRNQWYGQEITRFNVDDTTFQRNAAILDHIKTTKTNGDPNDGVYQQFACLTSMKHTDGYDYMIILGNSYCTCDDMVVMSKEVMILNLQLNTWLDNVPYMDTNRRAFSCIVNNNKLYAIGGSGNDNWDEGPTDTVEWLDVSNMGAILTMRTFNILSDRLSKKIEETRAVAYGSDVICIGGKDQYGYGISEINVIDTNTDTISVKGDLGVDTYGIPAIIANGRLHVFVSETVVESDYNPYGGGGDSCADCFSYGGDCDSYSPGYCGIECCDSLAPTRSPSEVDYYYMDLGNTPKPTVAPTGYTKYPTISPTKMTNPPTYSPTYSPTKTPSFSPTFAPSDAPSYSPSAAPSNVPTLTPTHAPSSAPSLAPTYSPTFAPTRIPTIKDAYDSFIDVVYGLYDLSYSNIKMITQDAENVFQDIERIIEKRYVDEDRIVVKYVQFWCRIHSVNNHKLQNIDASVIDGSAVVKLQSQIECNKAVCDHIITNDEPNVFASTVTNELRSYFAGNTDPAHQKLIFSVLSMKQTQEKASAMELLHNEQKKQLKTLNMLYYSIIGSIAIICICIGTFGCIDAFKWRINNYFRISGILSIVVQTNDMISDCFFVIQVSIQNSIESKPEYNLILYGSLICIVMPAIISLFQLYFYANKKWLKHNEHIRRWLSRYISMLLLLSVATGNSFTAVRLLNSQLFKLPFFDMGLTQRQLRTFYSQRIFSVVLLENIPQLCFQTWFIFISTEADNYIAISSIAFSMASTIVSLLGIITKRHILQTQTLVSIRMNVTGQCVLAKAAKCRLQYLKLRMKFANLFGIDARMIEIIKPIYIKDGLLLKMFIYINDEDSNQIDYETILKDAACSREINQLAVLVKEGWNLSSDPTIADIKSKRVEAEEQKTLTTIMKTMIGSVFETHEGNEKTTEKEQDQVIVDAMMNMKN